MMNICTRTVAAFLAMALTAPALAQAPAQPGLGGDPIVGLCLLSREAIFANAKVGIAASARLKQISDQAQAEVDAERKPIDAEVQSFQAEAAKLSADQRRTRELALEARLRAVQTKAQQRSREIDATRVKAMERISLEAQPVIAEVYKSKRCGLLVDRNSALGGNMSNDLTAGVVKGLDTRIATISFEREQLAAQAPAAPGRLK